MICDQTRDAVFGKVGGRCYYCGVKLLRKKIYSETDQRREFTIDHIIPRSGDGTDDIGNLAPCCRRCNSTKGTKSLHEFRLHVGAIKFSKIRFGIKFSIEQIRALEATGVDLGFKASGYMFYFENVEYRRENGEFLDLFMQCALSEYDEAYMHKHHGYLFLGL